MALQAVTPAAAAVSWVVPPLASSAYKGQAGKIAVLGGCAEYTGAPFYAALSALKLGADLSHVFCDAQAAVPIKSYSPELIVHGCLSASNSVDAAECERQAQEVTKWFGALSGLVVGPGLGRDPTLQAVAAIVVKQAVAASLPCVIDADGLRLVMEDPQIVHGSRWTVLTPNKPEYERLIAQLCPSSTEGEVAQLLELTRGLGGPTLVRKGPVDLICDGQVVLANEEPGCPKRSGGQGDVLAGSIATMLSWARAGEGRMPAGVHADGYSAPALATWGACLLTRRFSARAFHQRRRSMTAPDLIEAIGPVFEEFAPAV